ncbi:nucleobase-ascorbate transporter 11-like isoform X3 [Neltuma alba]|uniref:nucleobase-ascorbate transporter 11-like isoform X3 n=1 Tax=Neltuma alba TaxID=207710 RepID=UPI0010A50542|nr:nucleobase-ascorbate transporter 11-like isoform X3 [Prosopis alba]XP_028770115.1 nucleobase-ascorbate transporter 11-like isoform X3 [Prosopis alba]
METGSSSEFDEGLTLRNGKRHNPVPARVEPFVPKTDHNPRELRSWAKRTGFVSDYSGEAGTSASEKFDGVGLNLERNHEQKKGGTSPKIEIDPILGRTRRDRGNEIQPENGSTRDAATRADNERALNLGIENQKKHPFGGNGNANGVVNRESNGHGTSTVAPVPEVKKEEEDMAEGDVKVNMYPEGEGPGEGGGWQRPPGLKCGLRENPGFVLLIYYGLQHYLSLAGSLIFIPLIMVPAMGGTDKDTATVISTMLFVSGITTILHSYFGTRLPLVQGSSFVYLAPALVIINAQEYRNLTEHKFRHIMRELQGAIIVGSIFQCILGFSGLMSLLLRLINPIVVAPTVAAVGLAFFSYGFPQAGNCIEISIPLIALVLIFTLYLRGISIFGHHIFRIYAVPLSVTIIWIYASFLTAGGAYNYKGCSPNIPSSNILNDACRRHAYTMKYCRTDVSNALSTAAWVGTYHTASLRVNSRAPTPGVVSRGIAVEGFCSILAGIWGTGTGSTTLTENMHTIDITKVANRKVVELGAALLILFSFLGKVGALLASIPLALAASVLCFMWALTAALGLSTLQYGQSSSFRNITIVGVSLFLGLSVPAYFQQYQPVTALILPSYLIPYAAASSGPFNTGLEQLDFAVNALLSMNMVVTLLVAFILDNTVPGSRQERGVYVWSRAEDLSADPSSPSEYSLPKKVGWCCCRAKCLGV